MPRPDAPGHREPRRQAGFCIGSFLRVPAEGDGEDALRLSHRSRHCRGPVPGAGLLTCASSVADRLPGEVVSSGRVVRSSALTVAGQWRSCTAFPWPDEEIYIRNREGASMRKKFDGLKPGKREKESAMQNEWSGRRGSNPRHPAWEAGVLPLNYSRSRVSKARLHPPATVGQSPWARPLARAAFPNPKQSRPTPPGKGPRAPPLLLHRKARVG
jgi:hypothetical protein